MAKSIGRVMELVADLIKGCFTGWIRINFVKGIMGKIEKGETIELK